MVSRPFSVTITAGNTQSTHNTRLGRKVAVVVQTETEAVHATAVSDSNGLITVTLDSAQLVDVVINGVYEK